MHVKYEGSALDISRQIPSRSLAHSALDVSSFLAHSHPRLYATRQLLEHLEGNFCESMRSQLVSQTSTSVLVVYLRVRGSLATCLQAQERARHWKNSASALLYSGTYFTLRHVTTTQPEHNHEASRCPGSLPSGSPGYRSRRYGLAC